MKKDGSNIAARIKELKLKPGLRRDISLFGESCIALGYTRNLKELTGFGVSAFGGISIENQYLSLIDVEDLSRKVDIYLSQLGSESLIGGELDRFYTRYKHERQVYEKIWAAYQARKPEDYLRKIVSLYPDHAATVGFYNSLMRYLGEEESKGQLSPKLVSRIGMERNEVAGLYPKIERILKLLADKFSATEGEVGEMIRFCLRGEIQQWLESGELAGETELGERQRQYVHLRIAESDEELLSTDNGDYVAIKEWLFGNQSNSTGVIRGVGAFPGKRSGVVYKGDKTVISVPTYDFILVAVQTHPDWVPLIKRAKAIVTDEGGRLCHAAITARELKVPCVIGTKMATQILKDGDLVEVDAAKGIVRKI